MQLRKGYFDAVFNVVVQGSPEEAAAVGTGMEAEGIVDIEMEVEGIVGTAMEVAVVDIGMEVVAEVDSIVVAANVEVDRKGVDRKEQRKVHLEEDKIVLVERVEHDLDILAVAFLVDNLALRKVALRKQAAVAFLADSSDSVLHKLALRKLAALRTQKLAGRTLAGRNLAAQDTHLLLELLQLAET
mmetsp:Transcript_7298/g.13169  ORF Transcript_7298/g.13169 Transcript_7298/m.13169 type:complete len:186 (+) Transcript_7298:560-1117(+)|eukprot:CAMPEP_0182446414 /NCGR_PEP_ID=MMETSP1172-20130603/4188_1 /TAXON_ID=708627 /ORGANISM="Timspurckia oligopyrenoides, Strain CCMP3278" /LENGTH=185 /DNA_ID=CAMNT_0024642343 /DNA_START=455 /DNA_END=1012 /DNA_ORIENTATION=-